MENARYNCRRHSISNLRELIAWPYFEYAWGVVRASKDEKDSLRRDAESMLDSWEDKYCALSVLVRKTANADGDDIVIESIRFPMLRQQSGEFLSLADYIKPIGMGEDKIGIFATTVDEYIPELNASDPYERMLAQTLADRLAEAAAEKINEEMPGIRPAVGYPIMPDMSLNFLVDELLDFSKIGISLTETGMMKPHASVSGLVFTHPAAKYFNIGQIGEDQLRDYAMRRGLSLEEMRKFIR